MVDYSKLEEHNDDVFDDVDGNLSDHGTHVDTVSAESALQRLRRSVEKKQSTTAMFTVPEEALPDFGGIMSLEFSKQITTYELEKYRKASKIKNRRRDESDAGKVSALVLAEKSMAVYVDGKKLTDEDDEPLTLRSEEILSLTNSRTAADGVRRLLGDGVTTSMSDALVAAAGFGDDYEETGNPT